MQLSFKQLEKTLLSHFRIMPDKEPTFRSRIKQLQRLNFPHGVNVGRGAKMAYGADHLFMLVSAFELIGVGLPAKTACDLVECHWPHLAAGYALAALQDRCRWPDEDEKQQVLAVFNIQSLHELQFGSGMFPVRPSQVEICDEKRAHKSLRPYEWDLNHTPLILSLGKLLSRVLKIAKDQAGVSGASPFSADFHAWLPQGEMDGIHFAGRYPDRSNLKIRSRLHQTHGGDPDSLTPDGIEEANEFIKNDYWTGWSS